MKPLHSVLLVTLFWASLPTSASSQETKLKVGYSSLSFAPSVVWVAKEAGLFKKDGLDVELVFMWSGTILTQALVGGDLQVGIMGGTPAISANLQGAELIIVGSLSKTLGQPFLVASKDITQVSQLKGKRIGIGRFGDSTDFMTRYILKSAGLAPEKDVSFHQFAGGSAIRIQALAQGAIDATTTTFADMVVAKRMGFNVLLDLSKSTLEVLNNDVVTTGLFVRSSRETVKRFVTGMVAGVHFYKRNKNFSVDIISKYTRSKDSERTELGYKYQAEITIAKPYPNIKGVRLALEQIGDRNPLVKTARYEHFVDASFVKELDESGYIDGLYK